MNKVVQYVKDNAWARYVILFMAGCAVGAIFYPSKTIKEEERQKYEERISKLTEINENLTKDFSDKLDKKEQEVIRIETELQSRIVSLTTEIRDLKSKVKTSYYKLVKPDGTIEERRFTESEVDESTKVIVSIREEFNLKISQIEEKWSTIHQERVVKLTKEYNEKVKVYEERIAELEKSREVKINERNTGFELGYLSSNRYYLHVTRDLFGPVFLGVHSQTNLGLLAAPDFAVGGGLGLRW